MSYTPPTDEKLSDKPNAQYREYYEDGQMKQVEAQEAEDPVVVKRILRKCDVRLLPILSVLYLLSFLDRSAIGNARVAGLARDLKLTSQQYGTAVTVFFVLYGLLEVPSNLVLKKVGAKRWLPFIMILWGLAMTLTCLVKSYEGLVVARLALGAAEAGLFPGVTYYLTLFYKRSESQFRVGVFFSAATIAGAFGGLLAFGLSKLNGKAGLAGWAWIFMVEGILTVIIAILAYFAIIDSPEKAKFLTPVEREILKNRLRYDGVDVPMNDEFRWSFVFAGLLDHKVWILFVIYCCQVIPLYSIALNLPAISVGLGYTGPQAQLITVPVYICASIGVICIALIADKYRVRHVILLGGFLVTLTGYSILYASYTSGVRYFGAFLGALGSYGCFPAVVSALTNNVGGKTKRSVEIGILIGIGGMAGMVSSNIFPTRQAPHYAQGCLINVILCAVGFTVTCLNMLVLKAANKNKDAMIADGRAARFTTAELSDMGDRSPYFRYTI